jgi:hypothetical protein
LCPPADLSSSHDPVLLRTEIAGQNPVPPQPDGFFYQLALGQDIQDQFYVNHFLHLTLPVSSQVSPQLVNLQQAAHSSPGVFRISF